ncbi:hypothetical protein ACQP1U_06950 [Actinomycetota bacterium]
MTTRARFSAWWHLLPLTLLGMALAALTVSALVMRTNSGIDPAPVTDGTPVTISRAGVSLYAEPEALESSQGLPAAAAACTLTSGSRTVPLEARDRRVALDAGPVRELASTGHGAPAGDYTLTCPQDPAGLLAGRPYAGGEGVVWGGIALSLGLAWLLSAIWVMVRRRYAARMQAASTGPYAGGPAQGPLGQGPLGQGPVGGYAPSQPTPAGERPLQPPQ